MDYKEWTSSPEVQHIESSGGNDVLHGTGQDAVATKHAKVFSPALADAVAKDSPSIWSKSMFQLYGIMALVTLSA